MGDGFVIDIVLFAMVAGFLFLRLRSVLGKRTGTERPRPSPFERPTEARPDNVVPLAGMADRARPEPVADAGPVPVAVGVAAIRTADPTFDEATFLSGARTAFRMIVEAFAKGDLSPVRPLLADDMYQRFAGAVAARRKAGQTYECTLTALEAADLFEARLDGRRAQVGVRFTSQQVNVLRDAEGRILDGHPDHPDEVVDLWVFARDLGARDPNWTLVATREHD